MHGDGEFSSHRHRGTLEAQPLTQLKPPAPEVIPPFLTGLCSRIHAAIFSFCAGVMPPMPILGRSLL
jgi:hypothetical protein